MAISKAKRRLIIRLMGGGIPIPPIGFVFLTDFDGAYLTDQDGYYLVEAA